MIKDMMEPRIPAAFDKAVLIKSIQGAIAAARKDGEVLVELELLAILTDVLRVPAEDHVTSSLA